MKRTLEQRRQDMQRRKRYRRSGISELVVGIGVLVGVAVMVAGAFYWFQGPEAEPNPRVAGDAPAIAPASSPSADASVPDVRADRAAAAEALRVQAGIIEPATGVLPAGLPEEATAALMSALESAGATGMDPAAPNSAPRLDKAAAAQVRDKLAEAQRALEALGGGSSTEIPEQDPAVLEQLPPDMRELYRASMGQGSAGR